MRDSLRLGRVAGFPVAVNWSVLVIVVLLAWGLAEGVLPDTAPGHGTATYWLVGTVGAVLLMCSLLAHELAHAVVAKREGVEVESLTLWIFGGIAALHGESPTPGADFRIAAAGPATSLGLGAVFGAAYVVLAGLGAPDLLVSVAGWLSGINVVLAVFNLVPGAPLDGGRILRAVLWHSWGDRYRAAAAATTAGQGVAYGLIVLGVVSAVAGDAVGGLWFVFIGWFLLSAARAEHDASTAEHVLKGVTVGQVMSSPVQTGSADLGVAAFIDRHVLSGRHSAYPVVDHAGVVVGLVTLDRLRTVPPARRAVMTVGEVALPVSHVPAARPDEPVSALLPRMTREAGGRALVFDQGHLVGIVTPVDVARSLEARSLLAGAGR